jgi:hypothetical protein
MTHEPQAIRTKQLERDIARAVDRLVAEYSFETEQYPFAVDVELVADSDNKGSNRRFVVSAVRVHLNDG